MAGGSITRTRASWIAANLRLSRATMALTDWSAPGRWFHFRVPKKNSPRLGALPAKLAPLNIEALSMSFSSRRIAATRWLIWRVFSRELPSGACRMPMA